MESPSKKVLIIYHGGAAFASDGPYKEHGHVQATEDEMRQHIQYDIAPEMAPHIELELKYLGGCLTGANHQPKDWNELGRLIANEYHDYDGFVVLHGQDTIPWGASQLAYSFQNLAKPVIFADGSLAQGGRGAESSHQAVITAIQLAAFSNIPEVSVLSSQNILIKGVDAIQKDAGTHAGFVSRNNRILVHIGTDYLREEANIKPIPTGDFLFVPVDLDIEINVYNVNPVFPYPMGAAVNSKTSGIIMQTSGAGFVPLDNANIRETLQSLKEQNVPVVAITDCLDGYIDFNAVAMGNELDSLNVIQGGSMTIAAATTKLRAAIAMQVPHDQIAEFIKTDLFGETKSFLPKIEIPGDNLKQLQIPFMA